MALHSFFVFFLFASTIHSLPFVYFHGIADSCSSPESTRIVSYLNKSAGVKGECIETGSGTIGSVFVPMLIQIQTACNKVKELEYLRGGFNIFAISQGTLIARGLIEFCDGAPPVKNFISLAGPQAGVAAIPYCETIFPKCCAIVQILFAVGVYTDKVQDFMTVATFYKVPELYLDYLENSKFLPKLNNERPETNSTYKDRFSSLNKLVLLMNEEDSVLIPRETSWFGYYQDGSIDRKVVPVTETRLFKENLFGLKTLYQSNRVDNWTVPGDHANLPDESMDKYVVPYLVDDAADWALTSQLKTKLKLHNKA